MKNRTDVTIFDMNFTLVGEESPEYTQKLANYVNAKMREVSANGGISSIAAAVLSAVNIADEYFKSVDSAENMRGQLKSYFDDASRLKDEISELNREISRLRKGSEQLEL